MPIASVEFADVPRALQKGIARRLPNGSRFADLTGKRTAHFVVMGFAGYKGNSAAWLCRCKCGKLFVREGARIKYRSENACGCLRIPKSTIPKYIRHTWQTMIARCYYKGDAAYHLYGPRGITVCKRWRNSVANFSADMGPRPSPLHILARRDKSANFTPANCYWGKRGDRTGGKGRMITYKRRTQNLSEWAAELGITAEGMRYRLNQCLIHGWDETQAITKPVQRRPT